MQPFKSHTGIAVPLIQDDINTDQIAPIQAMRNLKPDYKTLLFMRARTRDDGSENPDFVLNRPQFRNPGILVTGQNFGAGSSREVGGVGHARQQHPGDRREKLRRHLSRELSAERASADRAGAG